VRLTQFTDYSLRVLLHAAVTREAWLTIADCSQAFGGLSTDHLAKIIRALGQRGWLEVRRGRGGGFRLSVAPERLTVGEVVRACEPDFALVECLDEERDRCAISGVCGLTRPLADARDAFLQTLDAVTLAEVIGRRGPALARRLGGS